MLALIMAAVSIVSPLLALTSSLRMANSRPSSNKIRPAMQDAVISAGGGHYSHFGKFLSHEMESKPISLPLACLVIYGMA